MVLHTPVDHWAAMRSQQRDKWIISEDKEFKALNNKNFAEIVDESSVPTGHPIFPYKWTYNIPSQRMSCINPAL